MKDFKIKNMHIAGLASWLNELQLKGSLSRVRSRLVGKLVQRYQENEKFRIELANKYAKKDKDGKPLLNEDKTSYVMENQEEFNKELTELYDETFTCPLEKDSILSLKYIVLDTDYVFGPKEGMSPQEQNAKIRQANDYGIWCQSFESIK